MKLSLCIAAVAVTSMASCATKNKTPRAASSYSMVLAAQDLDGKTVGSLANKNATIVVFFATWCQPCRKELKILGELHEQNPQVRIIGVNAYEEWSNLSNATKLRGFLKVNAPWLQVVRADKPMFKAFGGVPKIPSMFIFDTSGRLVRAFRRDRRLPPSRAEIDQTLASIKPAA